MTPLRILLPFCILSMYMVPFILSQQQPTPEILYHDCAEKDNFTTNSAYQTNLNNLLTTIYTNTEIDYGFYNFSYGEEPDKVYAIGLCRPDMSPDTCRACIKNSSSALTTLCPNFKEAIGGNDYCMLRYSNRSIFNLMEEGPYFWVYNAQTVSDVSGHNKSLVTLLGNLGNQAAAGNSHYKYAVGNITAPSSQTIYALVQCTPDLSESACRDCLHDASGLLPQCCDGREGGRVIFPSCNFRYEKDIFYDENILKDGDLSPSLSPLSPSLSPSSSTNHVSPSQQPVNTAISTTGKGRHVAGGVIASALLVLILACWLN